MTHGQLRKLLDELRRLPAETEWLEFKQASAGFDFNKLGKYFSALSNEANLKKKIKTNLLPTRSINGISQLF